MTQQWGRPLTGEKMKWARLDGNTTVIYCNYTYHVSELSLGDEDAVYHLPTNHIAYQVLDHNEKHGTSFVPWYGGDSAPDDWDGKKALFSDENISDIDGFTWESNGTPDDIIGYTVREEATEVATATVTIPRMTAGEAKRRYGSEHVYIMSLLGLIKPEPTREERFWAEQDVAASVPHYAKAWVRDALEFER